MTTTLERRWTHEGRPELHRETYRGNGVVRRAAEGPWWAEPDKIQWVDPATDLDCLMVRNHFGAWCGYVGVPPGHPWHGLYYGTVNDFVEVHGGLTFASSCDEEAPEGFGICHVPFSGREPEVWWLGWDAGHFMDYSPGLDIDSPAGLFENTTYKDEAYCRAECANLARQVAAAA